MLMQDSFQCPEEKPKCQNCVRHATDCQYPTSSSTVAPLASRNSPRIPTPQSINNSTTPRRSPIRLESEPLELSTPPCFLPLGGSDVAQKLSEFSVDDMALLHHWTLSTSRSVVESPAVDHLWQDMFPRIGFRHHFVMHGILSLAALHLAHLDSGERKKHMADAARRHNLALQGLQVAIGELSESNSDAVFVCASINVVYVFGMYGQLFDGCEGDISHNARTARILGSDWIPMIRGVQAVLESVHDQIRHGPLNLLLDLGNWMELDPDKATGLAHEKLCSLSPLWAGETDCETYDDTLFLLRKSLAYMQQFDTSEEAASILTPYNRKLSGPMIWLHFISDGFIMRLHKRQPTALLLFAYYGIILHAVNNNWIYHGWGKNVVGVVNDLLGDYWEPWLKWPKEVVGLAP